MSTPNDLQALLASIRPRPSQTGMSSQEPSAQHRPAQAYPAGMFPPHPQHPPPPYDGQAFSHSQLHGYNHPSVLSLQSPSPSHTPPRNPMDVISPAANTPKSEWDPPQQEPTNGDKAVNLLNLLRFSQSGDTAHSPRASVAPEAQTRLQPAREDASHGRNISASDLVASLMGPQSPAPRANPSVPVPAPAPAPIASPVSQEAPNDNTQDILLRLLNRPQSGASKPQVIQQASASRSISSATSNEPKVPGYTHAESLEAASTPFENPAKPETVSGQPSKDSMFTYVNPFDQLARVFPSSSPQPYAKPNADAQAPDVSLKQTVDVPADKPVSTSGASASEKRSKSPVLDDGQREAVNDVVSRFVSEIGRSLSDEAKLADDKKPKPVVSKEEPADFVESFVNEALKSPEKAFEQFEELVDELEDEDSKTKSPPRETETAPVAPIAQIKNEVAEALADSWESAEDSAEKDEERIVTVQNFPLRPFISIAVNLRPGKLATFSDDRIMDIARLKKDFDQLDRSLTAATSEYIVYALAKSGGIRIIRQEDGSDRQVFRSTRDRVFNVALSSSLAENDPSDMQAIIGIGVSGAVYWALISRDGKDLFELDALESESLIFPPFPASDENTSGGQLKTRAKRSSRHADLFAIGRGKNIYVISPRAAVDASFGVSGSQRTVNTEKFFKERALKISTGKAGKDFAFSDDDTVIASLDKTGRLRFWDIRDVLDQPSLVEGPAPNEVKVPLSTFVTGSPTEKSWPTSVLFLDKLRPYSRSNALRYVLVGLKQNHTLQLWDIGLGKAVEEVKFPHENESDAICSVAYHPASGIIVVGHPTRNSIYFVHLSAPRYNLPSMSQASFIKAAGDKESALPKPESTACLSGIREISLGSKGQLRSLELLPLAKSTGEKQSQEDDALFELYVMHSRGVTCLNITKEDMGWSPDNKVVSPVDAAAAIEEGWIEVMELQSHPTYIADEPSLNGETNSTPSRAAKEGGPKKPEVPDSSILPSRNPSPNKPSSLKHSPKKKIEDQLETPTPSGTEKPDKKKKKKTASAPESASKSKEQTAVVGVEPLPSYTQSVDMAAGQDSRTHPSVHPSSASRPALIPLEHSLAAHNQDERRAWNDFIQTFHSDLDTRLTELHQTINMDRNAFNEAAANRQDGLLRMVSQTLENNLEQNLTHLIREAVNQIPQQLQNVLSGVVESVVSEQLQAQIHARLPFIFEDPRIMQPLNNGIVRSLIPSIDRYVSQTVDAAVNTAVASAMMPYAESVAQLSHRMDAQDALLARRMDAQDSQLAAIQTQLDRIESLALGHTGQPVVQPGHHQAGHPRAHPRAAPAPTPAPAPASAAAAAPRLTPEELELQTIARLFSEGRIEDATVKWVQSAQQADLFDKFFVEVDPSFLRGLSSIVLLSAAAAVTATWRTNTRARLSWLELILQHVRPQDPEVAGVSLRIMEALEDRLRALWNGLVADDKQHPLLRIIPALMSRVRSLHQ